jgi:hypothetical protein
VQVKPIQAADHYGLTTFYLLWFVLKKQINFIGVASDRNLGCFKGFLNDRLWFWGIV